MKEIKIDNRIIPINGTNCEVFFSLRVISTDPLTKRAFCKLVASTNYNGRPYEGTVPTQSLDNPSEDDRQDAINDLKRNINRTTK